MSNDPLHSPDCPRCHGGAECPGVDSDGEVTDAQVAEAFDGITPAVDLQEAAQRIIQHMTAPQRRALVTYAQALANDPDVVSKLVQLVEVAGLRASLTKLDDAGLMAVAKYARIVASGEPTFVLRAQDTMAPRLVDEWAGRAMANGVTDAKVVAALKDARMMLRWQRENPGRVKVPD